MFEADDDIEGDEDPYFNADEIAFKVRLQCHKDRKVMVKKLIKTGEVHASEPSPLKPTLEQKLSQQIKQSRKRSDRTVVSGKYATNDEKARENELLVLNETDEPEEEEETYADYIRSR